jgi:hypothetical protein
VARRSTDCGQTWSEPVFIEPPTPPEGSKVSLVKIPTGRIYAVYTRNSDNLREALADDGSPFKRVDSLGYFVFKYSDDNGQSWSKKWYDIDVREMEIDRKNPYQGKIRFFWNSARSFTHAGSAYVPLTKVGGFGEGSFTKSEGVLLKSNNMLTQNDPEKISWETLPKGDTGLRALEGPIAEEHSYSVLSDGTFFCVYRTVDGSPLFAYSRDGGYTWSNPSYMRFADGHLMKHPRAANFAWKCSNGKFLYWFHNHGGRFIKGSGAYYPYEDRNPVWLCGGVEEDSPAGRIIKWSQPEIILYDDDPFIRISYPDLIEEDGDVFLTESNKDIARVHRIDARILKGLWGQFENSETAKNGIILESMGSSLNGKTLDMPVLPEFKVRDRAKRDHGEKDLRQGFTVELWLEINEIGINQIIIDNRTDDGIGFKIELTDRGTISIALSDGRTQSKWDCDPNLLEINKRHHIVAIVDGGPKIISFVIDGKLCDGGESRQFGWGRFSPNLRNVNGSNTLRVSSEVDGKIQGIRIYDRYLLVSEAIGNWRSGL